MLHNFSPAGATPALLERLLAAGMPWANGGAGLVIAAQPWLLLRAATPGTAAHSAESE
jgi:hypothetical protein